VLTRDYPISAIYHDTPLYPMGATVLPGQYEVVLTLSGCSYLRHTQTLEVKMDPRVKTSAEDLRRHFELDEKIAAALRVDYDALVQVRSVRAQLTAITTKTFTTGGTEEHGGKPGAQAIQTAVAALEAKAATLEGDEGGSGGRYLSTPEGRSLVRLNSGLNALVSALDTADAGPTTQQVAMFGDLEKALEGQLAAWGQLTSKDIPALNDQLKKAGWPPIDAKKPVPGSGDLAGTTSQDRDQDVE
jgi:hypothetical protein